MSFEGVKINKLNGGLGRTSGNADRVVALIGGATATSKLVHKKAYELLDLPSSEVALGVTPSTDANNAELIHYNLSEMFRLAPGVTFYLIPVDKTTTIAQLVGDAEILAAIRGIKGVNVIGISGIASAPLDTINVDVLALQRMVNNLATEHLLIDGVFLEGVAKNNNKNFYNSGAELYDLRSLDAPNVSVVIGQDVQQTALNVSYAKRAAVGTVLGSVAVRNIHEDLGSVDIEKKPGNRKGEESYSLSDTVLGRWLQVALSDGTLFSSLTTAQQKVLADKGYIYVGSFAEYPGVYLSGCPTAVAKTSDYAYFNFNCIWNKAARIIRTALIPKIRAKVPIEPETGLIKSTWIADAEGLCKKRLEAMVAAGNADGVDVYISPEQVLSETKPMEVKALVVAGQVVHEFSVDLGLTNKL